MNHPHRMQIPTGWQLKAADLIRRHARSLILTTTVALRALLPFSDGFRRTSAFAAHRDSPGWFRRLERESACVLRRVHYAVAA